MIQKALSASARGKSHAVAKTLQLRAVVTGYFLRNRRSLKGCEVNAKSSGV